MYNAYMAESIHLDNYCERTNELFWSEPINALTNIAFLIAAYFAYKFWKAKAGGEKEILVLTWILAIVGVGSFLFHTFATSRTMLADVIPIGLFIYLAIFSAAYRVFGLKRLAAMAVVIGFFGFNYLCEKYIPADWLNGSMMYIPALSALLTMTLVAKKMNLQAHKAFMAATIIFVVSLSLRSVDMLACDYTPMQIGTHFMWHVLNGLLMFNVIRGLLLGDVKK